MAARFVFGGRTDKQLAEAMAANEGRMAAAFLGAANDIANEIRTKGRADIQAAGNFGARWSAGLDVSVDLPATKSFAAKIAVTHKIKYFSIFETGGPIVGKPLLWIPFSYTGLKISASKYAKAFGLFYVENKRGLPMLFSMKDRKPKYFGVSAVTLAKRFHISEISEQTAAKAQSFYNARMAG